MYKKVPELLALLLTYNNIYLQKHNEERFTPVSYTQPHNYLDRWEKERADTLKFTPFLGVEKFPVSGNEWLYGWTYRNKDGTVHIRDDLVGMKKLETDLHECGHTPDEYETRARTAAKLNSMIRTSEKYQHKPKEYRI